MSGVVRGMGSIAVIAWCLTGESLGLLKVFDPDCMLLKFGNFKTIQLDFFLDRLALIVSFFNEKRSWFLLVIPTGKKEIGFLFNSFFSGKVRNTVRTLNANKYLFSSFKMNKTLFIFLCLNHYY